MLVRLAVRDIVLIERLDIAFDTGLSVLTGETGAGKSIIIDALSLALGGRGDGSLVRQGAAQGSVTAAFDLPAGHPARRLATEHGAEDDGDLVLKRVQFADGRTRALLNDRPVSVQALRETGAALVEIHGQHDDRALVDPATHRAILDAFGGHQAELAALAATFAALSAARVELEAAEARAAEAAKEAEYLRHSLAELTKLAAEQGEEAKLAAERQRMMQGEKVARELADAQAAVSGSAGPGPTLSAAMRRLERHEASAGALVAGPIRGLAAALAALDEAGAEIDAAIAASAFEPRELEQVEERLFALRAAARKFRVGCDDLPAKRDHFAAAVAAIETDEALIVALGRKHATAVAAYVAAAKKLSAVRKRAAGALDKAVNRELPPLKLERATFTTQHEVDETLRGDHGYDRVEFHVRTNPGSRPGPILRVASGGELARFLLALKVVIADRGSAPTLVFDEIDTGVGGAVADAIGARLARLAARVQVLAVTHAPQVAARAARHYLIAKASVAKGTRVATSVETLAEAARREEIARMLAGATITEEARAAAQRLMEGAR